MSDLERLSKSQVFSLWLESVEKQSGLGSEDYQFLKRHILLKLDSGPSEYPLSLLQSENYSVRGAAFEIMYKYFLDKDKFQQADDMLNLARKRNIFPDDKFKNVLERLAEIEVNHRPNKSIEFALQIKDQYRQVKTLIEAVKRSHNSSIRAEILLKIEGLLESEPRRAEEKDTRDYEKRDYSYLLVHIKKDPEEVLAIADSILNPKTRFYTYVYILEQYPWKDEQHSVLNQVLEHARQAADYDKDKLSLLIQLTGTVVKVKEIDEIRKWLHTIGPNEAENFTNEEFDKLKRFSISNLHTLFGLISRSRSSRDKDDLLYIARSLDENGLSWLVDNFLPEIIEARVKEMIRKEDPLSQTTLNRLNRLPSSTRTSLLRKAAE